MDLVPSAETSIDANHQHAKRERKRLVGGCTKLSTWKLDTLIEEQRESDDVSSQRAKGAEELSERDYRRPLVEIAAQLRTECDVRHVIKGHGSAGEHCKDQQPAEQPKLTQSIRRTEEKVKRDRQRQLQPGT